MKSTFIIFIICIYWPYKSYRLVHYLADNSFSLIYQYLCFNQERLVKEVKKEFIACIYCMFIYQQVIFDILQQMISDSDTCQKAFGT